MRKTELRNWERAVIAAFAAAKTDRDMDFFREWVWAILIGLYGEARAYKIWMMS